MSAMAWVFEAALALLLLLGAAFTLVGSWGLAKLGSFPKRLHGPSKATTLGVGGVLLASALWFAANGEPGQGSWHEILVLVFLFVTAPVSAHLLVKAALKLDPGLLGKLAEPPSPGASPEKPQ